MSIKESLEEGYLQRITPDKELIEKELNEADYDFGRANKALEEEDYKWCTVKSYFSMFHSARAVLFSLGYREKRHFAIGAVLDDLREKGKLESRYVNDFKGAMSAREGADYHYSYSRDKAEYMVGMAEEFNRRMKKLLKA